MGGLGFRGLGFRGVRGPLHFWGVWDYLCKKDVSWCPDLKKIFLSSWGDVG